MNKSKGMDVECLCKGINLEKDCDDKIKYGNIEAASGEKKPRFFGMLDVVFYVVKKDNNIDACLNSLKAIKCPENVSTIDVVFASEQRAAYYATIDRPAEIQIILPSTTLVVNEYILYNIIDILESDHDISLLGVIGAVDVPLSGRWQDSDKIYGGVYEMQADREIKEYMYGNVKKGYELVQCIDDTILIQAGLPSCMYYKENEFLNAKISNFANNLGYKIAVATPEHPWCMVTDRKTTVDNGLLLAEYVNYLQNDRISLGEAKRFFTYGRDSHIDEDAYFSHPSKIYIGDHVCIGSGAYFTLEGEKAAVSLGNYTELGNMVTIRSRFGVRIGHHVKLGNYVVIDDTMENGNIAAVKVGSYVILENNVTVLGGVTLGNSCTVKAGSVVMGNLPAYCVAAGNPAKIISIYDARDNSWKKEPDEECVEDILRARKKEPLLSIGIPTYNRSFYLRKALKFICDAVGDDDLVEIYISDNCSQDGTQDLVRRYAEACLNVRYHRQDKNIGSANNFMSIWENTNGKYVWLLGDDDYISQNIVHDLVTLIMDKGGFSICAIHMLIEGYYFLQAGHGMDSYVMDFNSNMPAITLLVLNRAEYMCLEDRTRFNHTNLNQVYIQLELLRHNPKYYILGDYIGGFGMGDANRKKVPYKQRGLLFEIFVRQFFDLLLLYVKNGEIKRSTYVDFIKIHFVKWMHEYIERIKHRPFMYRIDEDAMAILKKYYGSEPYYDEMKKYIEDAIEKECKD